MAQLIWITCESCAQTTEYGGREGFCPYCGVAFDKVRRFNGDQELSQLNFTVKWSSLVFFAFLIMFVAVMILALVFANKPLGTVCLLLLLALLGVPTVVEMIAGHYAKKRFPLTPEPEYHFRGRDF